MGEEKTKSDRSGWLCMSNVPLRKGMAVYIRASPLRHTYGVTSKR